jgi:hypothetical protein
MASGALVAVRPEEPEEPIAADRRIRRGRDQREQRHASLLRRPAKELARRTGEGHVP